MATIDVKATPSKQSTAATDKWGNPTGTTYSQEGKATKEGVTEGLADRPQTEDKRLMYEENGEEFKLPEGHDATLGTYRADIKQLDIAIEAGGRKIKASEEMLAEADAEDKPIFDKAINSQKLAVESNTKKREELIAAKNEFELSLVTPDQRKVEREYKQVVADIERLLARKTELDNKRKTYGIGRHETTNKGNMPAVKEASTEEQQANYKALLDKYETQGAVIIALLKEGKTNSEIAKFTGIAPANVPGPKNKWLRSEAAQKEEASN